MSATLNMCSRILKNALISGSYNTRIVISGRQSLRLALSTSAPEAESSTEKKPEDPTTSDENETSVDEVAQLEAKFKDEQEKLTKQIADIKDKYQRSLAETENVRQRMRKQIDDTKLFGIQGFCKDMLEVADSLGTATASVPKDLVTSDNPHLKGLHDGLVLTEGQLLKVFNKHGLYQINPSDGEKFDPDLHEALFQQPRKDGDNKKEDTVAVVTKIGYKLHDRTIRPALVGVFK